MNKVTINKKQLVKKLLVYKDKYISQNKFQKDGELVIYQEIENCKKAIKSLTLQLSLNPESTAAKYLISQIEELDNKIEELKLNFNSSFEKNYNFDFECSSIII